MANPTLLITALGLLVVFATLHWLAAISTAFILGFILSYLCLPITVRLEHCGLPRGVASIITLLLLLVLAIFVFVLPLPLVKNQLIWLVENLPSVIDIFSQWINSILPVLNLGQGQSFGEMLFAHWDSASKMGNVMLGWLISSGNVLTGFLATAVLTPLVMF